MKQTTIYKILLTGIIIVGTWSCERDDICAETTPTTPHLNILFYDINNPNESKSVREFTLRALDTDGSELEDISVGSPFDSISLPLRTINETVTTRFALEKDSDFSDDDDDMTNSNIDVIAITYTPQYEYVSRACGYKSIFTNLSITVEPDGSNWILTNEILTTTIENEDQAHVIFRH